MFGSIRLTGVSEIHHSYNDTSSDSYPIRSVKKILRKHCNIDKEMVLASRVVILALGRYKVYAKKIWPSGAERYAHITYLHEDREI